MVGSTIINRLEEIDRIMDSQPEKTRTYRVTKDVARQNGERLTRFSHLLRPMTEPEICEIANYLGVPEADLRTRALRLSEVVCPVCGRHMTFTDMFAGAEAAVKHDSRYMGEVLLGKRGHFITICGTNDDTHFFCCLQCGDRSVPITPHYDCHEHNYTMTAR